MSTRAFLTRTSGTVSCAAPFPAPGTGRAAAVVVWRLRERLDARHPFELSGTLAVPFEIVGAEGVLAVVESTTSTKLRLRYGSLDLRAERVSLPDAILAALDAALVDSERLWYTERILAPGDRVEIMGELAPATGGPFRETRCLRTVHALRHSPG